MRKLLIIAAACAPLTAQAVEDKEVALCASMKDTVLRLSCFDALADKHGLAPKTVATPAAGKGKWYTSTKTDPLTDKSVHVALLTADQGVGKYGDTIDMIVRCKDNQTEFYVNWHSFLGTDSTEITHRIDKDKAVTSTWDVSTDRKAAFMRMPVKALKRLATSESFVANVTPYGESPVTALFDTKGTDAALADIRNGCGW